MAEHSGWAQKMLEWASRILEAMKDMSAEVVMVEAREDERRKLNADAVVTASTSNGRKNWTIMVYLGGDNNLAEEMVYALKSMYSVGSTAECAIYALYDAGLGPVRFLVPTRVERREKLAELRRPREAWSPPPNSGDLLGPVTENNELLRLGEELRAAERKGSRIPEVASVQSMLTEFVKSCVREAPAHHYMLVLSGHGTGSAGDFLAANKRFTGLTIPDLRETLRSVTEEFEGAPKLYRKMDILGMDSCQMSTAEVAYEVREYVDFVVGAEGFEPNTGWPYDQMLARLNERIQEAGSVEELLHAARKPTDGKEVSTIIGEVREMVRQVHALLMKTMKLDPETVPTPPGLDEDRRAALVAEVQNRIAEVAALQVVLRTIAEKAASEAAKQKNENTADQGEIRTAAKKAAMQALKQARDRVLEDSERNPRPKSSKTGSAATGAAPGLDVMPRELILRASQSALRAAQKAVATAGSEAEILQSAEEAAREDFLAVLREKYPMRELSPHEEVEARTMAWEAVAEAIADEAAAKAVNDPPVFPKPISLAAGIVREYVKFYSSDYTLADVSTDLSALDLSKTEKLAGLLQSSDGLSQLMIDVLTTNGNALPSDGNAIILAHWEAQGYKDEQNVDLWDFCKCLRARCEENSSIAVACEKVMDAIDDLVVSSGYCGPAFQHSHGLSVYFPWTRSTDSAGVPVLQHYRSLDFALDTRWDTFLEQYTNATQRKLRKTTAAALHESTLNRHDFLFLGEPQDSVTDKEVKEMDLVVTISEAFGEIMLPNDAVTIESGKLDNPEVLIGDRVRKGEELGVRGETITVRDGRVTVRDGRVTVRDGRVTVRDGRVTVREGRVTVRDGRVTVRDGEDLSVRDGRVTVRDGRVTVRDGRVTVRDGQVTVRDGGGVTVQDDGGVMVLDVAGELSSSMVRDGRVTVRDGRVTVRDGRVTVRDGRVTVRDGEDLSVRDGRVTVRDGRVTVRDGRVTVRDGEEFGVRDGRVTVRAGEVALPDGLVRDGRVTVRDGRVTVRDGRVTVRDGRVTVRDGRVTVRDGRVTVREGDSLEVRDGRVTVRDGRVTVRSGGLGLVTKIASMKNPPFSWRDCELVAKGLKQVRVEQSEAEV